MRKPAQLRARLRQEVISTRNVTVGQALAVLPHMMVHESRHGIKQNPSLLRVTGITLERTVHAAILLLRLCERRVLRLGHLRRVVCQQEWQHSSGVELHRLHGGQDALLPRSEERSSFLRFPTENATEPLLGLRVHEPEEDVRVNRQPRLLFDRAVLLVVSVQARSLLPHHVSPCQPLL